MSLRVDKCGFIRWEGKRLFVSSALSCEYVELRRLGDDDGDREGDLCFGPVVLGQLREGELGLVLERPRKKNVREVKKVSGMSSVQPVRHLTGSYRLVASSRA